MKKNQPEQKAVLLQQADIFANLPLRELEVIAESAVFREFLPGEAVFREGEAGSALYIVVSGEISVRKPDSSGRTTDIARFIKGNGFGELDLFTGNRRTVSAFASEKSRLLQFPEPGRGFRDFLEEHPAISARILHKILVQIAGRIRRANHLIRENSPLMRELRKQVYRDKPTGLYNHTFITERIRELAAGKGSCFALLVSKPDNFKNLNDTYGHEAGDEAIRIMGRRLRDFTGDDENTARYKGNAMAVLLPGCGKTEALQNALKIREFLCSLDLRGAAEGNEFPVTASIGISLFPDHGKSAEALLALSHELALEGRYRGGNTIMFPEDREKQE
jgi:diguanylate cyclase (GGDEF)-like protein